VLDSAIASYEEIVRAPIHANQSLAIVPGILEHFDLPQIRALSKAEFVEIDRRAPNGSLMLVKGSRRRGEDWPLKRVLPEWFR